MALTSVAAHRYEVFPLPAKLTVTSLPEISPELARTVADNPDQHLALELSHVEAMDSSFLRLCVNIQKRKRDQGRDLFVINPSAVVRQILCDTNLDRVITVVPNIQSLLETLSQTFRQTYAPYCTEAEGGLLEPKLRCAICSGEHVSARLVDLMSLAWEWPGTEPFPLARDPQTSQPVDTLAIQPIVCCDCLYTSLAIDHFHVMNGKQTAIESRLSPEEVVRLSKAVKNRRKMMDTGNVKGDHYFDFPRSNPAVYDAYRLAADSAKACTERHDADSMFLVGYLNYAAIRYAPSSVRDELVGNCRSWLSRSVETDPPASPIHRAQSYLILIVSALGLEKYKDVTILWGDFQKMIRQSGMSTSNGRADSPAFWYEQCVRIMDEAKDKINAG